MTLRVLAAGSNSSGQLANKTLDDSHTMQACVFACEDGTLRHNLPDSRVISIASGSNHTLLLLERHSLRNEPRTELWGCGDNRYSQLGPNSSNVSVDGLTISVFRRIDRNIFDAISLREETHTISAIAASWQCSFIVLRPQHGSSQSHRDVIYSMGANDFHSLGVDVSEVDVTDGPHRIALESVLDTYSAAGFKVMEIAAGTHHVVTRVRLETNCGEKDVLIGWGACRHGQLGANVQLAMSHPRVISLDPANPPVSSIALGSHHTIFLHPSGRVTGFGSNKKGQISGLETLCDVKSIHCTWNGTYLIFGTGAESQKWEIQASGSYDKGQLGCSPISEITKVSRTVQFPFNHDTHLLINVACGSEHALALFAMVEKGSAKNEDMEVWGWGWNEHGNLGLGNVADVLLPVKIWSGRHILGIWAGCATSWIVEGQ